MDFKSILILEGIIWFIGENEQGMRKLYIGVIGASCCDQTIGKMAFLVGQFIAQKGGILICGGMGGVMEKAAQGAKSAGGTTVGILPGISREEANPYIDYAIVTGLGEARNLIIVRSSDAIVAISGGYGTLSEIAFSLKLRIPLVGLRTWEFKKETIVAEFPLVDSPQQAVETVFDMAQSRLSKEE